MVVSTSDKIKITSAIIGDIKTIKLNFGFLNPTKIANNTSAGVTTRRRSKNKIKIAFVIIDGLNVVTKSGNTVITFPKNEINVSAKNKAKGKANR